MILEKYKPSIFTITIRFKLCLICLMKNHERIHNMNFILYFPGLLDQMRPFNPGPINGRPSG